MNFVCNKCGYTIKASISKHVNSCNGEGPRRKRQILFPKKRGGWNKGLETSEETKNKIKRSSIGKKISIEQKQKLSVIAKKRKFGGVTKGGGKGIKGWYKGFWCDSSWELAWIIYNLEHGINFERNTKGFEYQFKNETKKYFPDFIIDDCYVEIKGWLDEKNLEKIKQFKGKLKVIGKQEMKEILTYVENKYGKNFIKEYGRV